MREAVSLLIVEDNTDMRELLITLLRDSYRCTAVVTAEEAMQLFTRSAFDLVLTDLMLPGASGFDLCQFVQASHPETVVILMSGSDDLEHETDATQCRAFDFLRKPFSLSRLEGALRQALRHQQLFRELCPVTSTSG